MIQPNGYPQLKPGLTPGLLACERPSVQLRFERTFMLKLIYFVCLDNLLDNKQRHCCFVTVCFYSDTSQCRIVRCAGWGGLPRFPSAFQEPRRQGRSTERALLVGTQADVVKQINEVVMMTICSKLTNLD